jgi:signal transduction histidine kinase
LVCYTCADINKNAAQRVLFLTSYNKIINYCSTKRKALSIWAIKTDIIELEKRGSLMLLFLPFLFLLTAFLFSVSKKSKSIRYLAILLFAFLADILAFMLYLGRDNYYYNVIQNYFGVSRRLWDYFALAPFSQDWIIRIINFSSMMFLYFCVVFSGSFSPKKISGKLLAALAMPLILQPVLYDPDFYQWAYLVLYPNYVSADAIDLFYGVLSQATHAVNAFYLVFSAAILCYSYLKLKQIKLIKHYMFLIVASFLSIIINYSLLLLWAPALLVKVSKIAHFTDYLTVSLLSSPLIYHLFPYVLLCTLAVITFGICRYAAYQQHVTTINKSISKEINAATIATSVFSHYIKNQIISIMAQLDDVKDAVGGPGEEAEALTDISGDCRKILKHIDQMHVLVENDRLCLKPLAVDVPIRKALSDTADYLKPFVVHLEIPSPCPKAMIDADYFSQVIINLLTNGAEAMFSAPAERKRFDITVESHSHWSVITVRDYGTGIAKEHLGKIFTPYYSTKNASKNWGIGLSLCHKIIMAHSGRISVSSTPGEGTAFTILLPAVSERESLFAKSDFRKAEKFLRAK